MILLVDCIRNVDCDKNSLKVFSDFQIYLKDLILYKNFAAIRILS